MKYLISFFDFLSSFSNRELAIFIWLMVIILGLTYSRRLTKSLNHLILTAFNYRLMILTGTIVLYFTLLSWFASSFISWNYSNTKTVIFWLISIGLPISFKSVNQHTTKELLGLTPSIIKWIIIFEFLINTNALSLAAELILIPIMTFIALMSEIQKFQKVDESVKRFFDSLSALFGLGLLSFTVYRFFKMHAFEITFTTMVDILIPIFLIVFSYPLLHTIALYSSYETLFLRLRTISRTKKIGFRMKSKFINEIGLNLNRIPRVQLAIRPLYEKSVEELLLEIRRTK